jgi:hypothetical protein
MTFQDFFTWKPSIINQIQRTSYEYQIGEGLDNFDKHKNLKRLNKDFKIAYNKALKLGLDVDLAYLNAEGKFEFADASRTSKE